ncbi:MAG: 1-acyl-sn-glycerol-3-phosphate acyltransferase [Culturomica sp.]|jgi:1-acyl-sn-glycerol-3-phosphate acyltransferase|nr:1-acyl-sn-glycerol-3-phosphate acyltransferase [Culturomica sp.]
MSAESNFTQIRPYEGVEIPAAVERLVHSEDFLTTMSFLSKTDKKTLTSNLQQVKSRDEFQTAFFIKLIKAILAHTSNGVTVKGLENLNPKGSYLFISNHRDIILDSAILNMLLIDNSFKYTQAAIGSNLFVNPWVTDMVKLNSCFTIERDISVKEMVRSSFLRSEYIRQLLKSGKNSVWIAQREGRTKNGDDRTQASLLKMLSMSGKGDFEENIRELNVVPVSISYEWEPCDDLKTYELYTKTVSEYVKTPEDDMNSMKQGLFGYKGHIAFVIGNPLDKELEAIASLPSNGAKADALAASIDKIIHSNFKLSANNYIAYDLLHSVNKFGEKYTDNEKDEFIKVMFAKLDKLEGNKSLLNNFFLEIYANPVENQIKST